jgi:hypothetical protein
MRNEPKILSGDRPEPPAFATPSQAEVWRKTVADFPRDYFPASAHGLLYLYCVHSALAAELAAHQDEVDPLSKTGNRRMVALTRHSKMAMHIAQQLLMLPKEKPKKVKLTPREPKPRKPWLLPSGKSLLMRDDD